MLRAKETIQHRVILIGNAAHTLSPIAAQGLNLALSEMAMLAQTIAEQHHTFQTPCEIPDWKTYLNWQQQQQSVSTRLSHQLPGWFSKKSTVISFARQLGLLGLDLCPPAKKYIAQRATGLTSRLPVLLYPPEKEIAKEIAKDREKHLQNSIISSEM
jgi:2-octaprenyl-6-methoxyphenol hydroxylase